MVEIVDSRSFNMVPQIQESSAFAQGMEAMMSRKRAAEKEAQMNAANREAGILAQALIIKDPSQVTGLLQKFHDSSNDPDTKGELQQLLSIHQQDPGQARNVIEALLRGQGYGAMIPVAAKPEYAKVGKNETLVDPSTGQVIYGNDQADMPDDQFLKEERKIASQDVSTYKKRAMEINTSYGKLDSLINQIESGSGGRQTVAAAIMNLARLISPGIVTDKDFGALVGTQDPIALALSTIAGKNEDISKQIQLYFDPKNPDLVDTKALRGIATAVTASEAPGLIQAYEEAKARATRSAMPEAQRKTIFGDEETIYGLRRFKNQNEGKVKENKTTTHLTDEQLLNLARERGIDLDI